MSDEISVEATGETVGEAKWAAMRELERAVPGVAREHVRFQVLSEGERGLLGVGYTPARVIASAALVARPAPPEDESPEATLARELLERAIGAIGVPASVTVDDGDDVVATLASADASMLIGRHGQTLDALQYLANALAARAGLERRIVVDAAGYRARRTSVLEGVARRSAEQASATGQDVALEAMTAVERKIVHEALKDDPEVETASEGSEPNRYVVVIPRRSAD